jgi:hypothetical protein
MGNRNDETLIAGPVKGAETRNGFLKSVKQSKLTC